MISTSDAFPSDHLKMTLHWSLMRMLKNALCFPESFSNRFAGGTLKSFMFNELLIILSFRLATSCISLGNPLTRSPFQTFSVSLDPNETIMLLNGVTNVKGKH